VSWKRPERVGPLIFEELCTLMVQKIEDPRLKGVTLTGVKMTKDLKIAKVYFSVVGGEQEIEAAKRALDGAARLFRTAISQNLRLRYLPELNFYYDRNLAHADRVERILHEIHSREKASNEDPDQ
jgi:ribosome-binding factor A